MCAQHEDDDDYFTAEEEAAAGFRVAGAVPPPLTMQHMRMWRIVMCGCGALYVCNDLLLFAAMLLQCC